MRTPTLLRELRVDPAVHPRGQTHLSSASALVQAGPWLYLVADDEHHLGLFEAAGDPSAPVELKRLAAGELAHDKGQRKKQKPDLEALVLLEQGGQPVLRALLALGSGSRSNRERGFLLELDSECRPCGEARAIDLSTLYRPLHEEFPDLNVEGAFVTGDEFRLLQRANRGDARNACISYPLADLLGWLAQQRSAPPQPLRITPYAIGEVAGVPLGFTDAAGLAGGAWIFSAVAEDTTDSYTDGACAGSVIGWVGADGTLERMEWLAGAPKVEGIAVLTDGRIMLVTDADDPQTASCLLQLEIP
ncbi:MAG: hypothetical protein EOO54_04105 [Haliea sp.]|nr:MAG: hypothetical protein EOO54_04105 [Haliea sp.]